MRRLPLELTDRLLSKLPEPDRELVCEKTSIGTETDRLLSKLPEPDQELVVRRLPLELKLIGCCPSYLSLIKKNRSSPYKIFGLASKTWWSFGQTFAYAHYKAVRVLILDNWLLWYMTLLTLMSSQVLSIHQQSYTKNDLYIYIRNYHQVLSIHQQSYTKNGLYICNYHQVLSIHQQSYTKNGLYICNYHQVLSIHQQSYTKNGLYIYMQLPPGLEHPSAELHEEWLIYMQLPPGLEHPSA